MAATTPNMALKVWNLLTDSYDHSQLAENFAKIDQHRHTEGQGLQIPTGGIENGAIAAAKMSPTTGFKAASGNLTTTTEFQDIANSTYTTTAGGTFLCVANFDLLCEEAGGAAIGILVVDGLTQAQQVNYVGSAATQRATNSGVWILSGVGSGKIIKLQAKKTGGKYVVQATHTRLGVYQIG
jgi:hypothetical protein